MLHPAEVDVAPAITDPTRVARAALRRLGTLSRAAGTFDAARYFRSAHPLGFYNLGTATVRGMARQIAADRRGRWSLIQAHVFASTLMADRHLEAKGLGVEVVARYRREFRPMHLATWKRWLARDLAANWATTDAVCGMLIGPLLHDHPTLVPRVVAWAGHRNTWVRRAAAVALVAEARRGRHLDEAYAVAWALRADSADLVQKAAGWLLREAGKTDMRRLERHLRRRGADLSRTTVRYAIERFPPATRRDLLHATRSTV